MKFSSVVKVVVFSLLWFVVTSDCIRAEEHNQSTIETPKKRPVDPNRISSAELDFLSKHFYRAEESLKERYENSDKKRELFLPSGITSVLSKEGDERVIAGVLAELTGSLNETQVESLQTKAQKLAQKIRQQDPEERDDRLLTLLERSEWLGFILKGNTPPNESLPSPKDEEAFKKFKKEFLAAYKEVAKKNKTVLENIEKAKIGNKEAKTWLREHLDTKSFARFLQGQKESGGDQLFEDVAEAVVWKDTQGNKYHDFQDADGRVKRVYVENNPKDHANGLSRFLKESPSSLNGFSLARKIEPGTPEVINLSKSTIQSSPVQTNPAANPTGQTSLASQALAIYKQNCTGCHLRENVQIADFRTAAKRITMQGNQRMPPPGSPELTPQEKDILIRFFTSNEPKTGF